jgi:hypothetical protein
MSTLRIKNIAHPSAEEEQIVLNTDSVELPASTKIGGQKVVDANLFLMGG